MEDGPNHAQQPMHEILFLIWVLIRYQLLTILIGYSPSESIDLSKIWSHVLVPGHHV